MVGKKIPKKEWMVLEHFILNESKKIEETLKKYNKITSERAHPKTLNLFLSLVF